MATRTEKLEKRVAALEREFVDLLIEEFGTKAVPGGRSSFLEWRTSDWNQSLQDAANSHPETARLNWLENQIIALRQKLDGQPGGPVGLLHDYAAAVRKSWRLPRGEERHLTREFLGRLQAWKNA